MDTTTQNFDVIVVGGGIIGCNVAHALCERGQKVAVIEAASLCSGTSANSFSWINGTSKVNSEAYHRLNASGLHAYHELARRFGEQRIGLYRCGTLEWSSPGEHSQLADLRHKAERLKAWDYPVAWVTQAELSAMEPHVVFREGAEGLFALADPWLDVPVFVSFLAERIRELGGQVWDDTLVEELLVDDDGTVTGVRIAKGEVTAPQVVLATGPNTPDVLTELTGYEGFRARFPMIRSPGLLVTTPPEADHVLITHILYDADTHVHLRPGSSGGLLLGSDETDGLIDEDSGVDAIRSAATRLLEMTQQMLTSFSGAALLDECSFRIGIRAVPADGDSIVGPLPSAEGLFVVCTHSGVTMGPAIGNLTAQALLSGQVPEPIVPFGLERFQF